MSRFDNYVAPSDLLEEANKQRQIMAQIAKAQRICNPGSTGNVEIQRLLLLAELKRKANKEEIGNISIREEGEVITQSTLKIKSIAFPLKLKLNKSSRKQAYVCVVSSGTKIFSSKVLQGTDNITFNDVLFFKKLSTDYSITISVYGLRKAGRSEKFQASLTKELRKLFRTSSDSYEFGTSSKFVLIGKSTLMEANLIHNTFNDFKLSMSDDSPFEGRIFVNYKIFH